MRKSPVLRVACASLLCLFVSDSALARAVVRGVPVAPAAQAFVPLVPRTSFLKNLAVSGAILWDSLQPPVVTPALPDLSLPPSLTATVGQAEIETVMPALGIAPETLPVSAKDLENAGRVQSEQPGVPQALESSLAEGKVIFDGSQVESASDLDEIAPSAEASTAKASYLAPTKGLSGQALLSSVHEISGRGFRSQDYEEGRAYMYKVADHVEQNGRTGILDPYSGTFLPGQGGDSSRYKERGDSNGDGHADRDGVNAEHVWPQSFFDRAAPMRSDLHHLMATLEHPNSIRSNFPFGEVPKDHPEYSNNGGARMAAGVFEPPDFAKGRVARAAFYFYSRYYDKRIFRAGGRHFWTPAVVRTLLDWNRRFPPTEFEMKRNGLIERWQGNRNPFIDDPGLADRIGADAFLGGYARNSVGRSRPVAPEIQGREQKERSGGNQGLSGRKHGKRWEKRRHGRGHGQQGRNRGRSGR
ncbi:MAG: endonuclease [Elusimicrobia bacterium]|nr:endonuclease [Elusimicrobiota bacterium]